MIETEKLRKEDQALRKEIQDPKNQSIKKSKSIEESH